MMTNVTELDSDRHIKMSIVEFIDAFGRLADKINITVFISLILTYRFLKMMTIQMKFKLLRILSGGKTNQREKASS